MAIRTCILTEGYHEAAFNLATEVFVSDSTLHRALKIELDEYRDYLRKSFAEMVSEDLSIVAIEENSEDIVGCLIATDFYGHLRPVIKPENKFSPLAALTAELCRQYKAKRTIQSGEVVLVDMGAVVSSAAGQGIYKQMRKTAQANAKAKGFTHIVGELSSASTQHVILKIQGHQKLAEVEFAKFAFRDKIPFEAINTPRSIILAEGAL